MLVKLSVIMEKDFGYFLLDTPYVNQERIINLEYWEAGLFRRTQSGRAAESGIKICVKGENERDFYRV